MMRTYFKWALSLHHNIHLSNIRNELNKPIEIFTLETCHRQRNENAVVGRHFWWSLLNEQHFMLSLFLLLLVALFSRCLCL